MLSRTERSLEDRAQASEFGSKIRFGYALVNAGLSISKAAEACKINRNTLSKSVTQLAHISPYSLTFSNANI